MRKRILNCPFAFLFLALPTSAFADAGWPTLLIAVSPIVIWYIGIGSILIEASMLWYFLRPSIAKALLMSLVANAASLVVGFLLGGLGVGYVVQTPVNPSPIAMTIFSSWHNSLIFMFLLTIAIELGTLKVIWKYDWRQLWLPVILMNILTYSIIEVQFLWSNGMFD